MEENLDFLDFLNDDKNENKPYHSALSRAEMDSTNDRGYLKLRELVDISEYLHEPITKLDIYNLSKFEYGEMRRRIFLYSPGLLTSDHINREFCKAPVRSKEVLKTVIYRLENSIEIMDKMDEESRKSYEDSEFRYEIHFEVLKTKLIDLLDYVPEYKLRIEEKLLKNIRPSAAIQRDKRRSLNVPTNKKRIKALKEFAPELWNKLQKSQNNTLQKKIIHLITGTNEVDAYKYSFGPRQKEIDSINTAEIDSVKQKFFNNK